MTGRWGGFSSRLEELLVALGPGGAEDGGRLAEGELAVLQGEGRGRLAVLLLAAAAEHAAEPLAGAAGAVVRLLRDRKRRARERLPRAGGGGGQPSSAGARIAPREGPRGMGPERARTTTLGAFISTSGLRAPACRPGDGGGAPFPPVAAPACGQVGRGGRKVTLRRRPPARSATQLRGRRRLVCHLRVGVLRLRLLRALPADLLLSLRARGYHQRGTAGQLLRSPMRLNPIPPALCGPAGMPPQGRAPSASPRRRPRTAGGTCRCTPAGSPRATGSC